jgi:hypothetical protein
MTAIARLRLAFAVSLAINLALGTYYAGKSWRERQPPPVLPQAMLRSPGGMAAERVLERAVLRLSVSDAAVLRAGIAAHADDMAKAQLAYLADLDLLRAAVLAEPIDRDALRARIAATEQSRLLLEPVIEAIILDVVPKLSPDGRRKLAAFRAQ